MTIAKKRAVDSSVRESRRLGHDERSVGRARASEDARVDESLGLQLISIRLPKRLIDQLKTIASHNGVGYQPLVRDVLSRFARGELIQVLRQQTEIAELEGRKSAASRTRAQRVRKAA